MHLINGEALKALKMIETNLAASQNFGSFQNLYAHFIILN
jgi:hypothetical protein